MSRKQRKHDREEPPPVSPASTDPLRKTTFSDKGSWIAAIWLVGFLIFFYSFTLPNNSEYSRLDVWRAVPFHLLDLVDPPPLEEGATPAPPAGWNKIPQRFDLMLIAGIVLSGAWGLGHLLLRLLQIRFSARSLEQTLFAFAVGLSGLSLMTLGCGLLGLLSQPVLGGFITVAFIAEWTLRLVDHRHQKIENVSGSLASIPQSSARDENSSSLKTICIVVMAPFLLAMFLGSMLPSVDFDVKEYHLQGPKEFFQQGHISFLSHNVYTSFPFLTEMLSLLAMVLRDDWYRGALAGKVILMSFAPLTAIALYIAGRRWFSPSVGWLAALIYLTTPWTYRISIIAYAEGGLTFYLFVTLLAAMIGFEKLTKGEVQPLQFLLTGLLAGSAMACKYTGVVQVVIPIGIAVGVAPFVLKSASENRMKLALRLSGVFLTGAILAIGPWLLKNTVQTGNPVYPLMYSMLGGVDWNDDLDQKWRAAHSPDNHHISDLGEKFIDVTTKSDWLSPLLFGLAPLSLFAVGFQRSARWLWLYVAYLFLAWWTFTHRIDRFWVPLIPVVSLLAAAGAVWRNNNFWKPFCGLVIGTAVFFNLGFITTALCGYNDYLIDLKYAQRLTASITSPEIEILNRLASRKNIKVLSVGDAECFDARFPVIYNTVFDQSIFQQWCAANDFSIPAGERAMRDPEEIRDRLHKEGITHIYVNWQEILRYRTTYGYTDFVTPARFAWLREKGILTDPILDPLARREFKTLSKQEQQEIKTWAPSLRTKHEGTDAFITSQIFPVATRIERIDGQ